MAPGEAASLRDGDFVPLPMPRGASAIPVLRDVNARGAWYASNVSAAPAVGGTPIELEVAALSPTELGEFVLAGANVSGPSLEAVEVLAGGAGPSGIMFQIFAKRNASLTGFEIASEGNVTQTVWVYMREGEFHGYELGAPGVEGWALVNALGGAVVSTLGGGRTAVVSVASVPLRAGRTYAFAIVGSEGVRYASDFPPAQNVSGCCGALQQHRMDCCRDSCAGRPCQNATEMADGYLSIHAGRALLTRGEGGSIEEFLQTWGDWERPRFFAGSVLYRTEVVGSDYWCRFDYAGPHGVNLSVASPVTKAHVHPAPSILNHQPSTINPQPSTLNHQPSTINPQP